MQKHIVCAIIFALMLTDISLSQQTRYTGTIHSLSREWIFYVPTGLPSSPPLVFCLQGCCSDYAQWASQSGYNKIADTAKIVVCYPKATNTSGGGQINDRDWDVTADKDLKFILALIDTAVAKYNIDQTRIYATGFSYGGCFSNYLGCMYPDKFAAIAPSAGYIMTLQLRERSCEKTRPVPVLHMHGTKDQVVSYSSGVTSVGIWVKLNECPQTPQVTNNYQGSATVKKEYYGPCKNNTEVIFLSAEGMGHAWMSQSGVGVSAASESWNFMKKYSLSTTDMADYSKANTVHTVFPASACCANGSILLQGMDDAKTARLVDVKGRVVCSWPLIAGKKSLSINLLAQGIYFLSVNLPAGSLMLRVSVQ